MEIYLPAEDSLLLSEISKKYLVGDLKNFKVLDLGAGSCIQSKSCISKGVKKINITAVDINKNVKKIANELGIKFVESNLFENLNDEKFDLILFNPPIFLKMNLITCLILLVEKKGDEIILKFIEDVKNYLSDIGVALLLTSSFTPEKKFLNEIKKQKLNIKKVATKKLFFEELYIWEIS